MKLPKIDCKRTKELIEDFIRNELKNKKAIIGLGGGVDSSVVLKLCEESIGNENILGLILPSSDTLATDVKDAVELAKTLNVEYMIKNIDDILNSFSKEMEFLNNNKLARGNLSSRIRMNILYAYSNELNGIVIGTTNKSEWLTGYFTKYGDGGVDIEPIIELYKTHVKELAKYMKIPKRIVSKKPSAGLWEGQTDEGELGIDYETLDKILYSLENGLDLKEFQPQKVKKVRSLISTTTHKRLPPKHDGVVYAKK